MKTRRCQVEKMKLTKETILELGQILKDEFNYDLKGKDLEKFAHSLTGYFDLILKASSRVRKSSSEPY